MDIAGAGSRIRSLATLRTGDRQCKTKKSLNSPECCVMRNGYYVVTEIKEVPLSPNFGTITWSRRRLSVFILLDKTGADNVSPNDWTGLETEIKEGLFSTRRLAFHRPPAWFGGSCAEIALLVDKSEPAEAYTVQFAKTFLGHQIFPAQSLLSTDPISQLPRCLSSQSTRHSGMAMFLLVLNELGKSLVK